jgi:hypothetical protein
VVVVAIVYEDKAVNGAFGTVEAIVATVYEDSMLDDEAVAGGFSEAGIDLQFEAPPDAPEEGVAQVN